MLITILCFIFVFIGGVVVGAAIYDIRKGTKTVNGTLYITEKEGFINYNLNVNSFDEINKAEYVTFLVLDERQNHTV